MQPNKTSRSNRIPQRFKQFSETLSNQIETLIQRSRSPEPEKILNDPTAIKLNRIRRAAHSLEHALPHALSNMSSKSKKTFIQNGLDALSDKRVWQELEYYCFQANQNQKLAVWACRVEEGLENLARSHFKNESIYAPFRVAQGTFATDITNAYELPFDQLIEVKDLMDNYLLEMVSSKVNLKESTLREHILKCTSSLKALLKSNEYKDSQYYGVPLSNALCDKEFMDPYVNNAYITKFLKYIAPNIWGETRSQALRTEADIHKYAELISPTFANELKSYVANKLKHHPKYQNKSRNAVLSNNAYSLVRFLHYLGDEAKKVINLIKDDGIKCLAKNDFEGFKLVKELVDNLPEKSPKKFNQVLNTVIEFYNDSTESNLQLNHIMPYALFYYYETNDSTEVQYLKWSYETIPAFFQNLVDYQKISLKRADGFSIQAVTLKGYVSTMNSALFICYEHLSDNEKKALATHGVASLVKNNHAILKNIRQIIQSLTKQGDIDVKRGQSYQNSIDNLLNFNGFDTIKSYKVNTQLRDKHAKQIQEKSNKLYSYKEVVELAYHIEQSLSNPLNSTEDNLALHAARIILKSGWNLTPTLELETNDIFYLDTPLHTSKTPAIRLFKRRADYTTKWEEFNIDSVDFDNEGIVIGKKVTPVFFDVLTVKKLTSKLQQMNLKLQDRIFVYESVNNTGKSKILNLTMPVFAKNITRLLGASNCSIQFSSQKIRKTGMNYIYRKVSREFKRYKKAGKHSYATFLQYYLKQDNKEVANTFSNALAVMADYFVRDITEKVIIVTTKPKNGKRVPNGVCTESTSESAVTAFKSQNRKLHQGHEIKACADFTACLWCPFYRCIADPEHVWKLLSYRDFVITDMKASAATFDSQTLQLEQIEHLKQRVEEVLTDLAKLNKSAILEGNQLLKEFGIHPDWEVVNPL